MSQPALPPKPTGNISASAPEAQPDVPGHASTVTQACDVHVIADSDLDDEQPPKAARKRKRSGGETSIPDDDASENDRAATTEPASKPPAQKPKKKKTKTTHRDPADPQEKDERGHLKDLQHIGPISDDDDDDDEPLGATADVDAFFSKKVKKLDGKYENRTCLRCKKAGVAKVMHSPNVTSLRRHINSYHRAQYLKWCKDNKFDSKLLPDVEERKKAAAAAALHGPQPQQTMLDGHLQPKPAVRRIVPLGLAITRFVAGKDLAISIVDDELFHDLILAAYHSKTEPDIPSRKIQRERIMTSAHDHFKEMRRYFAGPKLAGRVSSTADCWSSDATDGYFGVTGHWIERTAPGVWTLKADLLAYTHVRYSHTGKRLGQALFKILERLGIEKKFGYCTGDNLQVNDVMLRELEQQFYHAHIDDWDADSHRLNCLAHTIHLATRAIIDAREEKKNRAKDARAETTMVRNVAVVQRGSSIRKATFHDIQTARGVSRPRNLLRDMPIRWSSTKLMLSRAVELASDVDQLLQELARREKSAQRRQTLNKLFILPTEWDNIRLFDEILALADVSQQAFSAEKYPTLYNALPALCLLLSSWEKRLSDAKYAEFHAALRPGIEKLRGYVDRIRERAQLVLPYFVSIVLHPRFKLGASFKIIWASQATLLEKRMESYFKATYEQLNGAPSDGEAPAKPAKSVPDIDDMFADMENVAGSTAAPQREPWRQEYDSYLTSNILLRKGESLVTFWGINERQWPTWAAIAADILPAMATSVSAERAFSSGGLTVTDQRSLLKGDVVEALQVLKSAMRHGWLMREQGPSTRTEMELVVEDSDDEGDGPTRPTDLSIVLDGVDDDEFKGLDLDDETQESD